MHVIGTAGHVDHGKSALVEALTGIHPDRLREEQEREMTIDLGFAWMTLPNGDEVGIIDVPGHRDFIENMLAGIGGIEATLFIVAADEGVMPQTREHLAIINLLEIHRAIVVLTKCDLVDDEWIELVIDELHQTFNNTVLEEAPIVKTSARTRLGIDELINEIAALLETTESRRNLKRPRLPIDRVFSIAGFGTVVTGTLIDGAFKLGDEVSILPSNLSGRIRGLQTHKRKEELVIPGSRTALNISGVTTKQIQRGDVVTLPGQYTPTQRVDVIFNLLADASTTIKHNLTMKIFIGSTETLARIRLLGKSEIIPGESGWLQLETSVPIVAIRGDRYILRRPSPPETLGGGTILDPAPTRRYKRFSSSTLDRLQSLTKGTPSDLLYHTITRFEPIILAQLLEKSELESNVLLDAIKGLFLENTIFILLPNSTQLLTINDDESRGEIYFDPGSIIVSSDGWTKITTKISEVINIFHSNYPLRLGIKREELKSRVSDLFQNKSQIYNQVIQVMLFSGMIKEFGNLLASPDHEIVFSPEQEKAVKILIDQFKSNPYSPPSIKECTLSVGDEVLSSIINNGTLIPVSNDVIFLRSDYDYMVKKIRKLLTQNKTITAAEVRDYFQTSRKYALALLEYLDSIGITTRIGDQRKLKV